MVSRLVLSLLLAVLLGACSSTSTAPAGSAAATVPSGGGSGSPTGAKPPPVSASTTLVGDAREARAVGDYSHADALLQRAQRLDSRNAAIYLEWSRLYRAQGDGAAARHMAERGLLYCAGATCAQLRDEL